jgi:hypothetical protein
MKLGWIVKLHLSHLFFSKIALNIVTVKHNKDVLIDQSVSISIIFLWIRAVNSESRQAPTKFIPPFIKIGLHILVNCIPPNPLYNLHVFNIFIINIMRNNRQDRYEDHNQLKDPELSNT